jgi:hypothetical protein
MSFVFGWYSFKIKSFTATDLNISAEEWRNTTFEVRQKVFHLFWIPFFSIGKMYALRKSGKLYDLPTSIVNLLKAKQKYRTPWYSFFLPIALLTALLGGGIFINVAEYFMRRESDTTDKQHYEIAIKDVQNKFLKLQPNSYLRLVNLAEPFSDTIYFLKLIETDGIELKFLVFETRIPKSSNDKYELKESKFDTLTFTKNDLSKVICVDYENFKERKSCGFAFLGGTKMYSIDAIQNFDEPIIDGAINWDFWRTIRSDNFYFTDQFTGFKNDRSWKITLELQNFGTAANLIEIKTIEGDFKWTETLPKQIPTYEYLKNTSIVGSTSVDPSELQFKSILVFQDSIKRKYNYLIEGKQSHFTIKKQ